MTVPRSVVNFCYVFETLYLPWHCSSSPLPCQLPRPRDPRILGRAGAYEDLTKCEYVPTALHPSQCNDPYATEGPIDNSVTVFFSPFFEGAAYPKCLSKCMQMILVCFYCSYLFIFKATTRGRPTQQPSKHWTLDCSIVTASF